MTLPATLDEAATQRALSDVLNETPFTTAPASEVLMTFLRRWFGESGDLYIEKPIVFWLTIVGLVVILAFLLWHVAYSLRATWRAVRTSGRSLIHRKSTRPALDMSPAYKALTRRDYRSVIEEAFLLVQRALSGSLERPTPRDWLRRLRHAVDPQEFAMLERLVGLHETACYANGEVLEPAAKEALSLAQVFVAQA